MRLRDSAVRPDRRTVCLRIGNAIWGAPGETIDAGFEQLWIACDSAAPETQDRLPCPPRIRWCAMRRLLAAGAALLRTAVNRRRR